MAKYKVAEGTQVNVGGVVRKAGETFEVHPGQVREAVLLGWAVLIESAPHRAVTGSSRTAET